MYKDKASIKKYYVEAVSSIDSDIQHIFHDEDIKSYIVRRASMEHGDGVYKDIINSIFYKMTEDFYFAFEHPATRTMGISLFIVQDEIKKQNRLMEDASTEGNPEEMSNVSDSLLVLDKRYKETLRSINDTKKMLDQSSGAMTLAEREREYYEYQRGRKKKDDRRDIAEERIVIQEKSNENRKLGLDVTHGLQDVLDSPEHEDFDLDGTSKMKDVERETFMNKIRKHREHEEDEGDTRVTKA